MRRRSFITILGGAAATWPLSAHAQQPARPKRIAALMLGDGIGSESKLRHSLFEQGFRELGWTVGATAQIDYRWSAGVPAEMLAMAKELFDLRPDVVFAVGGPSATAFQRMTKTIPIVFVLVSDPVGAGLIESLARPGGNITGFINVEGSVGGKWLQLLKQIAPSTTHVSVPFNPRTAAGAGTYFLNPIKAAGTALGIDITAAPVDSESEIERAIVDCASKPGGGLIVPPDPYTSSGRNQDLIIGLTTKHRLPMVNAFRYWPARGGLISYANNQADLFRRAPVYIDRILRGESPAALPVQVPVKFEMVINLKTAKVLDLNVPGELLGIADEVIE